MIIYAEEVNILSVSVPKATAHCRFKMLEIDGREMDEAAIAALLGPEELKKIRKEFSKRREKEARNNPAMPVATKRKGKSTFGGYGGKREKTVPVMQVLTGPEKADLRNIFKRYRKGHFAELKKYWKSDRLDEALTNFYATVMKKPRIIRITGQDSMGCLCKEIRTKT